MGARSDRGPVLSFANRGFEDRDLDQLPLARVSYPYHEVDFSQNRLAARALPTILDLCLQCDQLRVLKLYKNDLCDRASRAVASFLRSCTWIEEVHLSHNRFSEEGVATIISAASTSRSRDAVPLWLRLEHNEVQDAELLLRDLKVRFSVCDQNTNGCNPRACASGCKVHLPHFTHQKPWRGWRPTHHHGWDALEEALDEAPAARPRGAGGDPDRLWGVGARRLERVRGEGGRVEISRRPPDRPPRQLCAWEEEAEAHVGDGGDDCLPIQRRPPGRARAEGGRYWSDRRSDVPAPQRGALRRRDEEADGGELRRYPAVALRRALLQDDRGGRPPWRRPPPGGREAEDAARGRGRPPGEAGDDEGSEDGAGEDSRGAADAARKRKRARSPREEEGPPDEAKVPQREEAEPGAAGAGGARPPRAAGPGAGGPQATSRAFVRAMGAAVRDKGTAIDASQLPVRKRPRMERAGPGGDRGGGAGGKAKEAAAGAAAGGGVAVKEEPASGSGSRASTPGRSRSPAPADAVRPPRRQPQPPAQQPERVVLSARAPASVQVWNVPPKLTLQGVTEAFEAEGGRVVACTVDEANHTALIRFATLAEAKSAVDAFDGGFLNDHEIRMRLTD